MVSALCFRNEPGESPPISSLRDLSRGGPLPSNAHTTHSWIDLILSWAQNSYALIFYATVLYGLAILDTEFGSVTIVIYYILLFCNLIPAVPYLPSIFPINILKMYN